MRVEARELTKQYGVLRALDAVGFSIGSGEWVALVGPNGSGKSTLNRVLMGLVRYEGVVLLDDAPPRQARFDPSRTVAYVPQVAPALAAPVRDWVRASTSLRGTSTDDVVRLAGRLGLDLEAVARRALRDLSGGMKQKLLVALALSARARLLILDEPTGSLDAETRERFFPLLQEEARAATVLLCSHRDEEVRERVDRVLELAEGRVVFDAPPAPAGSREGVTRTTLAGAVEVRGGGA